MGPNGIPLQNEPATFEKRVMGMISNTSAFQYTRFVAAYDEKYDMQRLLAETTTFKTLKMCLDNADVIFQKSYKPGSSLEEVTQHLRGSTSDKV